MKKKNLLLLVAGVSVLAISSCNKNDSKEPEIPNSKGTNINYNYNYYNNNDYNNLVLSGSSKIENQWEDHGVSSPFILRHNGMYYLYSSTPLSFELGVVDEYR